MTGVAIIGYGYWGPHLARNFAALPNVTLAGICDSSIERLEVARIRHPGVATVATCNELLRNPDIHAIAISTPLAAHFELARACLAAGKHVLVEKPLAATSEQAQALGEEATRRGVVLLVDHTYLYSSAVERIAAAIADGELGELHYYDSVRTNLGRFRADVDVFWDLASHDLAIIDFLFNESPTSLQASGYARGGGASSELGYLTLRWGQRRIAHCHVSWLTPVKVRRTLIGGSRAMIVYDDLDPVTRIQIYESAHTNAPPENHAALMQLQAGFRRGDMRAPLIPFGEPLYCLAQHFVECIAGRAKPRSGAASGTRVVQWLEAVDQSLASGGAEVELTSGIGSIRG